MPHDPLMDASPRYRQLARHYQQAIESGALRPGSRLPSVRELTQLHQVSLTTALQACRTLESEGWAQARDRSGYFAQLPQRRKAAPLHEPATHALPDPAQFVGVHERVSEFVAQRRNSEIRLDLAVARAAPQHYPAEALRTAMTRVLRQHPELLTTAMPSRERNAFREAIAHRAVRAGMALSPDDVLPTHGCIEALNLALRAVAQPGDTVAVESPTFYGLLQVLESLGMRALEIPTSPQTGVSIEALSLALDAYADIKAVVVIPHLQNPLGSVMPEDHKRRLAALCRQRRVALIEDDTYSELLDSAAVPRALKSFDTDGNVIHCASLHKTLAPGLRLGWVSGGRWHARIEMLKYAQTRSNEALPQAAVGAFMATGAYDRHLRRLRAQLAVQRESTADVVASTFPPGTRMNLPPGGLQLWIELPTEVSSTALFEAALREHILIAPGTLFSNTSRFAHFIRINTGSPFDAKLEHGLRRLGSIAHALMDADAPAPDARPPALVAAPLAAPVGWISPAQSSRASAA